MKAFPFHPCHGTGNKGLVLGTLLLLSWIQKGTSTIQAGNTSVPTLRALFGKSMSHGRIYHARLQFLRENPYLCDHINPNTTSYVVPTGEAHSLRQPTTTSSSHDGSGANFTFINPVALVAARGECPFERKANIAASVGVDVEFLIVYNFNVDGDEDAIVPMYSEDGKSNLVLLSTTHRGGQLLKTYIAGQSEEDERQGGPIIDLDAVPPEGMTIPDLQSLILSGLILFFMLVSFSSCVIICAGAHGYGFTPDGRLVLIRQAHPGTPGMGAGAGGYGGRHLLTEEEVRQVSHYASTQAQVQDAQNTTNAFTSTASVSVSAGDGDGDGDGAGDTAASDSATCASASTISSSGEEPTSCAVCIDDFASDADDIIVLPCRHKFHTDCIVPWLTERQAKCPLCKFDVMAYCLEMEAEHQSTPEHQQQQQQYQRQGAIVSTIRGLSDRILRYRWTRILGGDEGMPDRDGVALAPNEMDVDNNELELTDQRIT